MTAIADIRDKDSFQSWLKQEELSRGRAVWLASRSALRVLPSAWRAFENDGDLRVLRVLRRNLIAGVAAAYPTAAIGPAAAAAALRSRDTSRADARLVVAAARASLAAARAARASLDADADRAYRAAFVAAAAAEAAFPDAEAAFAAAHATTIWDAIRGDCRWLVSGGDPVTATEFPPLWHDIADPPFASDWDALRRRLAPGDPESARGVGASPDWSFWTQWYQRHLDGTRQPDALLRRIALSDLDPAGTHETEDFDPFWEGTDKEVQGRIDAIRADFARQRSENGERIVFDETRRHFSLEAVTDIDPGHMSEVVATLENLLELIAPEDPAQRNPYPLDDVIRLLRDAAGYGARPRMMHSSCKRILRRLGAKIRNGDCPDPEVDADIADLFGTVTDVVITLEERDPQVKEAAALESGFPTLPPDSDAAKTLAEAATEIQPATEGALAEELLVDAKALIDPNMSEADRKEAGFRTSGRLLRIWIEFNKLADGMKVVAGFTKDVTLVVGAATSPIWLQKAIPYILGFFG